MKCFVRVTIIYDVSGMVDVSGMENGCCAILPQNMFNVLLKLQKGK